MAQQQQQLINALTAANSAKPTISTSTSYTPGYKISINPALKYQLEFPSQLEADVFFADVDASIIASSTAGHSYFKKMITDKRPHPFHSSARFLRSAPKVFGNSFSFDHNTHDDRVIIKRISKRFANLGHHLLHLIENGAHASWESKNAIIHQYYRATLPASSIYFLRMVPDGNGLALRQLMRTQAQSLQFSDAKLATISTAKVIRQVKYNRGNGLIKYFGLLNAELGSLGKVGMIMEPGSFAELDLVGHIFEHLSAAEPYLSTEIDIIRRDVGKDKYNLTLRQIKIDLLKAERLHNATKGKSASANNLQGNSLGRSNYKGGKTDPTARPWKRDYSAHIILALVAFAKKRHAARAVTLGTQSSNKTPKCYNCDPDNSIHRRKRRFNGHSTTECNSTLIRAFNGFTAQNACTSHPDGCHLGSKCSQKTGKRPTANNATATMFPTPTTPTNPRTAFPIGATDSHHHMSILMALPIEMRAAYAESIK